MREIKYHEQPHETASEKNADNGSTHSSWVLRTSLPFTQVSPAGRQEPPFQLLCLTPRSLRYLNITPSWGVPSLSGLIPCQPHLHCVGSAHSPMSCADPAPGFLSQARGGGERAAPGKAVCLQPTPVPDAMGFQSLL